MAWSKQVCVLVVWCFLLMVGDSSKRAVPFGAVHCPCDFPPGKQELGTKGSPAEAALRRPDWGAWAVHCRTSVLEKTL